MAKRQPARRGKGRGRAATSARTEEARAEGLRAGGLAGDASGTASAVTPRTSGACSCSSAASSWAWPPSAWPAPSGRVVDSGLRLLFGVWTLVVPVVLVILGVTLILSPPHREPGRLATGFGVTFVASLALFHLMTGAVSLAGSLDLVKQRGGAVGSLIAFPLRRVIGFWGARSSWSPSSPSVCCSSPGPRCARWAGGGRRHGTGWSAPSGAPPAPAPGHLAWSCRSPSRHPGARPMRAVPAAAGPRPAPAGRLRPTARRRRRGLAGPAARPAGRGLPEAPARHARPGAPRLAQDKRTLEETARDLEDALLRARGGCPPHPHRARPHRHPLRDRTGRRGSRWPG